MTRQLEKIFSRNHTILIALSLLILNLACKSPNRKDSTLIIGLNGDIDSLNELTAVDVDAAQIIHHMLFMRLTRLDENLEVAPCLAKAWEFTNDHTLLFHLRTDVTWSDGRPTTAEDVVFTWQKMIDPQVAYIASSRFDLIRSISALNDSTVQVVPQYIYPDIFLDLQFPVLPKHVLSPLSAKELLTSDFGRKPVTNGPYLFEKWQANRAITFRANPNYCNGKPAIDRIIFSIIPEETTLITSFLTGEIDLIPRVPFASIKKLPDNMLTQLPSKKFTSIAWNGTHPLLTRNIRRALTHAINKKEIIKTLFDGFARPALGPFTPLAWAFDSTVTDIPFDTAKAMALLQEAGWQDTDNDGFLEKEETELAITLSIYAGSRQQQNIAAMVQAMLKKIGVRLKIEQLEWNLFLERIYSQRQFEAAIITWDSDFIIDPSPLWHTEAIKNGFNLVSYANATVDSLIACGRRARVREAAMPIWRAFQQTIINDCPYTFLFIPDDIIASNSRLDATFDLRGYLATITKWKLKEN